MKIHPEQLAPCGLYCGVCRLFHATQDDDRTLLERLARVYARRLPEIAPLTADDLLCDGCVMDVSRREGRCSAGSARFGSVLKRKDIVGVTSAPISPVLWSTSFQCQWVRGSFCVRSRIGESTERNSGSWLKRSAMSVRHVGRGCTEVPNGVHTASLRWT